MSQQSHAQQQRRTGSLVTRLGWIVLAAALGLGVGLWWRDDNASPDTPAAAPIPIQVWLLNGKGAYALDEGRIALPTGSEFKLRVRIAQAGRLVIYEVSRQGQRRAAPLFVADLLAGKAIEGPVFTLSGERGAETLEVQVIPIGGRAPHVQRIALWHF